MSNVFVAFRPNARALWGFLLPSSLLGSVCNRAFSALAERFLKTSFKNRLAGVLKKPMQRRSLSPVLYGMVCVFAAAASAQGTAYHIDNQPGSNCSDTGPHTLAKPWCAFGPANHIRTFLPGDQILLCCEVSGVARVWVAAHSGIVSIRGHLLRPGGNGGASVSAAINLVSGRNVIPLWSSQGVKQWIGRSDQMGFWSNVDNVQIAAGDMIRFEIHGIGESAGDAVSWTPSVGYVANRP
jgi:hypothetical protein